jgi:hypothetical protein
MSRRSLTLLPPQSEVNVVNGRPPTAWEALMHLALWVRHVRPLFVMRTAGWGFFKYQHFAKGAVIYTRGDPGDVHFLAAGSVGKHSGSSALSEA